MSEDISYELQRKKNISFYLFILIGKHAGTDKRLSLSLENEVILLYNYLHLIIITIKHVFWS